MLIFLSVPYLAYTMIFTSVHFSVNDRISFLVSAQYILIVYDILYNILSILQLIG